jgi:hypothetical protein
LRYIVKEGTTSVNILQQNIKPLGNLHVDKLFKMLEEGFIVVVGISIFRKMDFN